MIIGKKDFYKKHEDSINDKTNNNGNIKNSNPGIMDGQNKYNKRRVGSKNEEKAAAYLEANGVKIIEKNYRCRTGEIDLIGIDSGCYVFFEVKYRKNSGSGNPAEAVNINKQKKICKVMDYYRVTHGGLKDKDIRFDVVAILGNDISWYKNAFMYI